MNRPVVHSTHQQIARWFFLLVSLGVGYLFWQTIQPFAIAMMTAGVAAVVLGPFEQKLRRIVRRRGISSFCIVVLVLLVIVGPLSIAAILMADQAVALAKTLLDPNGWAASFTLLKLPFVTLLPQSVQMQLGAVHFQDVLLTVASWISGNIGSIFSSSVDFLFKTFIFFICLYYFLVDRERLIEEILRLSPLQDKTDRTILDRMTRTIRAVVAGSLIVALVQGVLSAIGMTIFGVPGALLWAALVIIAANIPFFGTAGVLMPVVIYLLINERYEAAVGLFIWSIIVVGLVDNLLKPLLVEGKTRMHPLLILLTILGGLQVFGPIGLIVGPTILAAFLALIEMYKAGVLEKRNV